MKNEMNNSVNPLSGKWYLRDISTRAGREWQAKQTFEGMECMLTFDNEIASAIAGGKVVYHASYRFSEGMALLMLNGSKLDPEHNCFSRVSEEYRIHFEGDNEMFLYSTDPGTEDAPGHDRYRFVRSESDEN